MTRPPIAGGIWRVIDESAKVGRFTSVWHHSVILAQAVIGQGCSIGSFCEIGRGSVIGDGSRIGSFTFLPSNTRIGERVFVGPHVMMCDDEHPYVHGAEDPPYDAKPPIIEDDAVIGAAAVLLPGVRIGKGARVAAGAVVTHDVPAGEFVRGEPARHRPLSPRAAAGWGSPSGHTLGELATLAEGRE